MTSFSVYLYSAYYFSLCKIMGFSNEDKILNFLIKNLHDSKGYRGYGGKN